MAPLFKLYQPSPLLPHQYRYLRYDAGRNEGLSSGMPEYGTWKILKVLAELTDRTGFDSAVQTVNQAVMYQATDADSLQSLYRRLYADVPELPPLAIKAGIPQLKQMDADLEAYDRCLLGGGAAVNG